MNNPVKNGALLTLGVVGAVVAASIVKRETGSMARSLPSDTRSIWVWRGYTGKGKRPTQTAYALDRSKLPLDSVEVQEVEPITVSTASPEYQSAVHNSRRKLGAVVPVWRVSGRWPGEKDFRVTDFHLTRKEWPRLGGLQISDLKRQGVEIRVEQVLTDTHSEDYAEAVENDARAKRGSAARTGAAPDHVERQIEKMERAEVLRLLAMAEIGAGARLDAFSDRLAGGGPIDAEDLAGAVAAAEARLEDAEYELKNDRIREHRVGNRADRDHYRRVLQAIRRLKPSR